MKTKPALPAIERRFHVGKVELREADAGTGSPAAIRGYAAKFNASSENAAMLTNPRSPSPLPARAKSGKTPRAN